MPSQPYASARIVVLAGGVGGARFLRGLRAAVPEAEITVVGNTGDDVTLFGLRVCPDLDTVMYTLGGGVHEGQGWGRTDETFAVRDELAAYGEPTWFGLGDRDIATHLVRTSALAAGVPLSEVTARLCERWRPGLRLLPMTDHPVETHVELAEGRVHFQEWWVRLHAAVPARSFVLVGAEEATPAPGVLDAIDSADVLLLPPSNPIVSIGTILEIRGITDAVHVARAPVVGLSPIVAGAPVRGMADACLAAIGVETSARGVAAHYGARAKGGLLDGWLVDVGDADACPDVTDAGIACRAVPLLMTDLDAAAAMARAALELAAEVAG